MVPTLAALWDLFSIRVANTPIRRKRELEFRSWVCFFAGETGFLSAQIVSFDGERLCEIKYEDTAPMQIVRLFVNHRESFLEELFKDTPSLIDRN